MTARVISIDDGRKDYRPVKMCCFWCGHSVVACISDRMTLPAECSDCGLWASIITHEAPAGWSTMSEEELAEHEFDPVR